MTFISKHCIDRKAKQPIKCNSNNAFLILPMIRIKPQYETGAHHKVMLTEAEWSPTGPCEVKWRHPTTSPGRSPTVPNQLVLPLLLWCGNWIASMESIRARAWESFTLMLMRSYWTVAVGIGRELLQVMDTPSQASISDHARPHPWTPCRRGTPRRFRAQQHTARCRTRARRRPWSRPLAGFVVVDKQRTVNR
jgi:hypothetical protein